MSLPNTTAEIDDAVHDEMLRMHVASTRPIIFASFGNSTLVYFILRDSVEPAWAMILWWWTFQCLMVVRLLLSKGWAADTQRRTHNRQWEKRFALIVGLGGLLWGMTGTLLYPSEASGLRPISALVQMGVSAAAVMSLSSVQLAYRSFFLCMMLPTIGMMIFRGDHIEHLTALAMSLFTALLLIGGRQTARTIEHAMRLRFDLASALGQADTARQNAEQANAAKSQFLTNMSHELRTPIHGVLSFAKMGRERTQEAKLIQYFDRITTSGERLQKLIDNLLDMSRFESNEVTDALRPVGIQAAIEAAIAEQDGRIAERRVIVQAHVEEDLPPVSAHPVQLHRLLHNLLDNAIRYSNPGALIQVIAARKDDALEILIADEGIGIPTGELELIFERFSQSSRTRSGAGGAGLGLSVCREIALQHGGKIIARHNSAGGADFVVTLPLPPTALEESAAPVNQER